VVRLQHDSPIVVAVNRRGVITRIACGECGKQYGPGDAVTQPWPSEVEADKWWYASVDDTRTRAGFKERDEWNYLLPIPCVACGHVMSLPWIKAIYWANVSQHPEQCRWSSGCGKLANPKSDDGLCSEHQGVARRMAIDRDGV
jgi:hypothetical protein